MPSISRWPAVLHQNSFLYEIELFSFAYIITKKKEVKELEEEFEENGIFDIALDMDSNYFINVKYNFKRITNK